MADTRIRVFSVTNESMNVSTLSSAWVLTRVQCRRKTGSNYCSHTIFATTRRLLIEVLVCEDDALVYYITDGCQVPSGNRFHNKVILAYTAFYSHRKVNTVLLETMESMTRSSSACYPASFLSPHWIRFFAAKTVVPEKHENSKVPALPEPKWPRSVWFSGEAWQLFSDNFNLDGR